MVVTMKRELFWRSPRGTQCRLVFNALVLALVGLTAGCSTTEPVSPGNGSPSGAVIIPNNFDQALKDNQKALAEQKGQPDVALYNLAMVYAHPDSPKKDYLKALSTFKKLVKEHPKSPRAEPARLWIEVLDQIYKNLEDTQKLADEKRHLARERDQLARERDQLAQERNKLNYAIEKSRQLDADIEMRRKQTMKR
jgi:tetratricopeptide (TPR) repeat protein